MFEDGYHQDDQDDDEEPHNVAAHAQRVREASNQQINIGEKYLEDGEEVRYAADQTANRQPFVLDNPDYANSVILDGELSYVASLVYEEIYNDNENRVNESPVREFVAQSGMDYETERQRMRGVYGASLPENEDDTNIDIEEFNLDAGFTKRGW